LCDGQRAMMRWRVLISAPYMIPILPEHKALLEKNDIEIVVTEVNERLAESELLSLLGDVDGVICGDDQFTDRVFARFPRLKVISKWGTGVDSIDLKAASRRGVRVCNTPDAFTDPVADSVLGYVLALARKLPWMDREMRMKRWSKQPGVSLRECALGVIGVGKIGRAVVERATAFGMRVLGNDVVEIPRSFLEKTGLEMVSKVELLSNSDFVSLNCDLNPTSFHLIGERELKLMKPTAYLINTARGPLIDEPSLVAALQEGRITGAALDVFEIEPLPSDSPLLHLDNCLLAPHNANSSPEAARRVHENTIRNLVLGLQETG